MPFLNSTPGYADFTVDEPDPPAALGRSAPGYADFTVGQPETVAGRSAPGYADFTVTEPVFYDRWHWVGGVKVPLLRRTFGRPWERPVVAGSLPVGDADYPIPSTGQVIYVSAGGSDANNGSADAPKASIGAALTIAGNGATIVVGAGTYHESVTMPASRTGITIQNAPGEEVWLDGSTAWTSGWTGSGPWTHSIQDWETVSGSSGFAVWNPLAHQREQLFYNGVEMTQVADETTPGAMQFSVNRTNNTVTIGSNPATGTVRNTDLARGLLIETAGATVRGIGIRRYSPSDIESTVYATVQIAGSATGTLLENVVIADSRLNGLGSLRQNVTVRNVTIERCGKNGAGFTTSDGLVYENNVIRDINRMSWKAAPTTAALKITRTIGFTMRDSIFDGVPDAAGIWTDVSVSRFTITNCVVSNDKPYQAGAIGVQIELSGGGFWSGVQHTSYLTNVRVTSSTNRITTGIQVWNSDYITVANCEVSGYTHFGLRMNQDDRHNHNGAGYGGQFENLPWLCRNNRWINNDVHRRAPSGQRYQFYANCSTAADPTEGEEIPGGEMFDRCSGNWFAPTGGTTAFVLSTATGTNQGYSTLALMYAATGVGDLTGRFGTNVQQDDEPADTIADPIGTALAAITGAPATLQQVGPYLPTPTPTY